MPLAVDDVLECTTYVRHPAGQNQLNRIHYKVTAVAAPGNDQQLVAHALAEFLGDTYDNILPVGSSFDGITLRRIKPTKTQVSVGVPVTEFPGTRGGDPLPPHATPVISVRSASAPLRVRGRVFLPSGVDADLDADGNLTAGYVTDLETWVTLMRATLSLTVGAGSIELIWSLYSPLGGVTYPIDNAFVRSQFASQKRRRGINRGDRRLI